MSFGVPSKDPFESAHCPVCRALVAPHMHYCKTCFATYDSEAAAAQIHAEISAFWKVFAWLPLPVGLVIALLGLGSCIDPESGDHSNVGFLTGLAVAALTPLAHFAIWMFASIRLRLVARPVEPPALYR